MKIALVSDIHGNRQALEAAIADAAVQGVDGWWALGDLVAIGPDPVPTLELLTSLPAVRITRGNTERYVLTEDRPSPRAADVMADSELFPLYGVIQRSFAWTCGALAARGWLDWLRDLPLEVRLALPDGTGVLGVHASPGRDDGDGITPQRDEEELRRDLEGSDAQLVLAGHTHQPADRVVGDVRAVNLGSVSNPSPTTCGPVTSSSTRTGVDTSSNTAGSATTVTRSSHRSPDPATRRPTTSPHSSAASRCSLRHGGQERQT